MVQEVLLYISLIVAISALLTILARIIKQPPIIAYLIAGIIVGPLVLNWIGISSLSTGILQSFARIGVAFLLFIVGLSLDFRLLKEIGKASTITGIIQVAIITFLGTLLSIFLGFDNLTALYIGVALAFSSTVVVVKILSDKKELETLHGKIAVGILIIQDILASIALMVLPVIKEINENNIIQILEKFGAAIVLIVFVFLLAKFAFNRFMNYLAKSQETLFLFGIAWALALATIFYALGFSMEIGALIAGMSLASSKYALDLEGKMKPLRDFFIVLFFVFFGSQLTTITWSLLKVAIILSIFVMIIKPLIAMYILKFLGYTKRTNFLASISLAQVSEFSLILVMLGFSIGQLNQEIMNLSVLVALITIGLSTYAMNYSHKLTENLSGFLSLFEGKIKQKDECKNNCYDIILIGYHRIGFKLFETLKNLNKKLLIVDYNPKVVLNLQDKKIASIYGDVGNKNFLNDLPLAKAKLIISTIPEESSNILIKEVLKEHKSAATFIATVEQPRQAIDLYNEGIDYVLIPHHLGGEFAAHMIKDFGLDKDKYDKKGKEHKKQLEQNKSNSTFD
jgi:Kef-type K+ transport system membrane component KefB